MRRTRGGKRSLGVRLGWLFLLLFVVVLLVLIAVASNLPKRADEAEIREILAAAARARDARAAAVERARKAVRADAAVPADWNYRQIVGAFDNGRLDALI